MTVQVDWGNLEALGFGIVFAGLAILVPYLIGKYRTREESGFMQQIAQTLDFAYQQRGDVAATQAQGLSGGEIYDVISGVHNGIGIGAFTYRILVGGKQRYWSYTTVLETPIPTKLPDIVLRPNELDMDGAANMALGRTSLLGKYEAVQLEGNFGKYFMLYVEKGAHIEALEVFTPDIMADMIDHYQSHGLEFSGDTLYLYPMKLIQDEAAFMDSLALLERLAKNLSSALGAMATAGGTGQQPSIETSVA